MVKDNKILNIYEIGKIYQHRFNTKNTSIIEPVDHSDQTDQTDQTDHSDHSDQSATNKELPRWILKSSFNLGSLIDNIRVKYSCKKIYIIIESDYDFCIYHIATGILYARIKH